MITYAIKKTRNPKGVEGTNYYHGKAIKTGDYTFEDLANDINNSTTVTRADALAVLGSIKPFVTRALLAGQAVVLQDLGRLQIGLRGKCYSRDAMAASDFSPSAMIKGHKVTFRPEVKLKADIARGFSLKRISSEAMK
jgi:predicted histone-like DNA-binding protein